MNSSTIFIIFAVVILVGFGLIQFLVYKNKKNKRSSLIMDLAFVFIVAGIMFSQDPMIGYSLIGVGLFLAITIIIQKRRSG